MADVLWPVSVETGVSYPPGSHLCVSPPPLDLWFWSIYQEEPLILCVLCFVCVCVGSVDFFLTPHTCHDRRSRDPLCKFISHPICVGQRMQMFTEGRYACVSKARGASGCCALERCQGSRACGSGLVCLPLLLKQWLPVGRLST